MQTITPPPFIDEAAQRYGVTGMLFDFGKGELVPFRDLLEELYLIKQSNRYRALRLKRKGRDEHEEGV